MLWFSQWVESKKRETVPYTPDKDAKPQTAKYTTMAEIWEQFDATRAADKFTSAIAPDIDIDSVIEDAFGDDVLF